MPALVVATATLDLKPSREVWTWAAPPAVSIPPPAAAQDAAWRVLGLSGILPRHLAALLTAPPLSAPLLFDVPGGKGGTLKLTEIKADDSTLSAVLTQGGEGFLVKSTTGTFKGKVVSQAVNPSGSPVLPAIDAVLSGTWSVTDAKQELVTVG